VPDLLLASRSPRRRELLGQLGVSFEVVEIAVDETRCANEPPADYVIRLAEEKAAAGAAAHPGGTAVLGADTAVVVDGETLGKPRDKDQAVDMLTRLSGRVHEVMSGVALWHRGKLRSVISISEVRFRELSPAECAAYWAGGEPRGKAGAYAIQGRAGAFVTHLSGSYSGVVGLPLYETEQLLRRAGIIR
jgi:septum formation protein